MDKNTTPKILPMDDRRLISLTIDLLANTILSFVNILFEEELRPLLKKHKLVLIDTTEKGCFSVFLSFANFMTPQLISDSIMNKEISRVYVEAWYKQNFDDIKKELELYVLYQNIMDEMGGLNMIPSTILLKNFPEIPELMLRDDTLIKIPLKISSFVHDFIPSVFKNNPIAEPLNLANVIDDVKKDE
ncbi:MAG: hypothetical protein Q8O30_02615 [Candidatus Omnitrophota bacterium]|nr:hypothetical protein [Candidatus Omnitrophota bacterium]